MPRRASKGNFGLLARQKGATADDSDGADESYRMCANPFLTATSA